MLAKTDGVRVKLIQSMSKLSCSRGLPCCAIVTNLAWPRVEGCEKEKKKEKRLISTLTGGQRKRLKKKSEGSNDESTNDEAQRCSGDQSILAAALSAASNFWSVEHPRQMRTGRKRQTMYSPTPGCFYHWHRVA